MPITEVTLSTKTRAEMQKEIMEKISEMISMYHVQVNLSILDESGKKLIDFSNMGQHFQKLDEKYVHMDTKPIKIQNETEIKKDVKSNIHTQVELPLVSGAQIARELAIRKINVLACTNTELTVQLIEDEDAYTFSQYFHQHTTINKLIIKGLDVKGVRKSLSIKGWIHVVPTFRYVQSVAISTCKIGMDEAIMIMTNLNQNLKDLDLWDNQISDDVAMYIVESISRNQMIINSLNLGSNDFSGETRIVIKKLLKDTGISVDLY